MKADMIQKYMETYRHYRIKFHQDYDLAFTVRCAVEHIVQEIKNSREEDAISYLNCEIEDLEKALITGVA